LNSHRQIYKYSRIKVILTLKILNVSTQNCYKKISSTILYTPTVKHAIKQLIIK